MANDDTKVYLGVEVELNGTPVQLFPKTPINDIKKSGFEIELAEPVELGKLGKAINSIGTDLGVSNDTLKYFDTDKKSRTTLGVDFLDNAIGSLLNTELTVEALYYKKPGQADPNEVEGTTSENTQLLFGASAKFNSENDGSVQENSDFFKLKGLYVVVAKGVEDDKVSHTIRQSIKRFESEDKRALPPSDQGTTWNDVELEDTKKIENPQKNTIYLIKTDDNTYMIQFGVKPVESIDEKLLNDLKITDNEWNNKKLTKTRKNDIIKVVAH